MIERSNHFASSSVWRVHGLWMRRCHLSVLLFVLLPWHCLPRVVSDNGDGGIGASPRPRSSPEGSSLRVELELEYTRVCNADSNEFVAPCGDSDSDSDWRRRANATTPPAASRALVTAVLARVVLVGDGSRNGSSDGIGVAQERPRIDAREWARAPWAVLLTIDRAAAADGGSGEEAVPLLRLWRYPYLEPEPDE